MISNNTITKPISISDVKQITNNGSNDLATLNMSNNINIYAKYKPVISPVVTPLNDDDMVRVYNSGLQIFGTGMQLKTGENMSTFKGFAECCMQYIYSNNTEYTNCIKYNKPIINGVNAFRLTDWNNYYSDAQLITTLNGYSIGSIFNDSYSIDYTYPQTDITCPNDDTLWTYYAQHGNTNNTNSVSLFDLINYNNGAKFNTGFGGWKHGVVIFDEGYYTYKFYLDNVPLDSNQWLRDNATANGETFHYLEFYTNAPSVPSDLNSGSYQFFAIPQHQGDIIVKTLISFVVSVSFLPDSQQLNILVVADTDPIAKFGSGNVSLTIEDENHNGTGWYGPITGTTTEFNFNYNSDDSANYQGKTGYVVITANGTEYAREEFTFE